MSAPSPFSALELASARLRQEFKDECRPALGIVLGSGLSPLAAKIEDAKTIPYASIPGLPKVGIEGHSGHLIFGSLAGVRVACLSGRVHLYEGHRPEDVVFGVRLLSHLGAGAVLLTNAAGGISRDCTPGSLMLITDHLNLTGTSPLVGRNDPRLGPRFPDMSKVYDSDLCGLVLGAASELGIRMPEGVYAGLMGPSYETPAEIRMLETLGASAVGMSTVLEAIALRHLGTRVVGISCITNYAAGKSDNKLSHAEVSEVAGQASDSFCRLVTEFSRKVKSTLA